MSNTSLETKVELALDQLTRVRDDLKSIQNKLDSNYVTIDRYEADIGPIKKVVYGLVSIVGTAVIVAIVGLVVQ